MLDPVCGEPVAHGLDQDLNEIETPRERTSMPVCSCVTGSGLGPSQRCPLVLAEQPHPAPVAAALTGQELRPVGRA